MATFAVGESGQQWGFQSSFSEIGSSIAAKRAEVVSADEVAVRHTMARVAPKAGFLETVRSWIDVSAPTGGTGLGIDDDDHGIGVWIGLVHSPFGKVLTTTFFVVLLVSAMMTQFEQGRVRTKYYKGGKGSRGAVPGGGGPGGGGIETGTQPERPINDEVERPTGSTQALVELLKAWLTDPGSRFSARLLVFLALCHWVTREASWAYVLSANHAEVTNSLTDLHEKQDRNRVLQALLVMLLWELLWAVPLMWIIDPTISQWFRNDLRTYLTGRVVDKYMNHRNAYYYVKATEEENKIDNPDQRIGEDIGRISSYTYGLYSSLLSAAFGCAMWTHVLFTLANPNVVYVCIGSCVLRTLVAWVGFGDSLVLAERQVLQKDADLRYGLTRVRDSAEEIALGGGSGREKERVMGLFGSSIAAGWANLFVHIRYGVALGILEHFPGILLWVFMLHDIQGGKLGIGDALRVHFAYDQVSKVLGFMVNNFGQFTQLQADTERIHALMKACDKAEAKLAEEGPGSTVSVVTAPEGVALEVEAVYVHPVCGDAAPLGGASFTLPRGGALLVMGPSGCGKTALFRAMAGLWHQGSGTVRRAPDLRVLPQRCYLPQGTLLDLVFYPRDRDAQDSGRALQALARAQLAHLVDQWGLEETRDWQPLLSPGEKQRVAFARLFVELDARAPVLVFLDEATSAVSTAMETIMYTELRAELGRGVSAFVSVGHRPALRDFHDQLLLIGKGDPFEVDEEGDWSSPVGTMPWRRGRLPLAGPAQTEHQRG